MDTERATAIVRLMTMIEGTWQTHAVAAFAELGLADLLGEGPRPVAELAGEAGADPDVFPRFIRACRSLGLVAEEPPGYVRLTDTGRLLRSAAASLRDFALVHATPGQLRPYELLGRALRDGKPTATVALGEPVWDYYGNRPNEARLLGAAIDGAAALEAPAVVAAVGGTDLATIVELRGGVTALLAAFLDAAPGARGILVDRPEIVAAARERIAGQLRDRVETRPADALSPPPDVMADLYLISHGLHFLDDDSAGRALRQVRDASHVGTRLVITDPVLTADSPAVCNLLDLHTLVLLGGRERTAEDFGALLSGSGWRLERIIPISGMADAVVAAAA